MTKEIERESLVARLRARASLMRGGTYEADLNMAAEMIERFHSGFFIPTAGLKLKKGVCYKISAVLSWNEDGESFIDNLQISEEK
jgi:hypothetical protein